MSQTKVLVFVAGAALSIGAQALAQNANLDQSRAYQNELIADAGTRASLLQGGPNGGATYAGTFSIADGSGNNRLNFGGTEIFRYNISSRDSGTVGDQNDFTIGFNAPVTRLRFWGNVWDKALTYKVQGNWGGSNAEGQSFNLEDAYAMYTWDNGFSMKWGQFRMALNREWSVEDEFQQGLDRSVTGYLFAPGYVQGIQMGYAADAFRFSGGFTDGVNTGSTDFNSPAEADWAFHGRVDWKVMGADWERFNDFTSWRSAPDNALLIGGGAEFQQGGETGFTTDVRTILYTVDAAWEGQGWNVFAAAYGAHIDPGAAGLQTLDNYGLVIQGGFFLADQVELFGRYEGVFLDSNTGLAGDLSIHMIATGVNYYVSPESHAAKLTAQFGYTFNDTNALLGSGGFIEGNTRNVFLGDQTEGEWVIGAQMQVVW
jgi:hypothetical protein